MPRVQHCGRLRHSGPAAALQPGAGAGAGHRKGSAPLRSAADMTNQSSFETGFICTFLAVVDLILEPGGSFARGHFSNLNFPIWSDCWDNQGGPAFVTLQRRELASHPVSAASTDIHSHINNLQSYCKLLLSLDLSNKNINKSTYSNIHATTDLPLAFNPDRHSFDSFLLPF